MRTARYLNRYPRSRLKLLWVVFCLLGTAIPVALLHRAWKTPRPAKDFPVKAYPVLIDSLAKYNPKIHIDHEQ